MINLRSLIVSAAGLLVLAGNAAAQVPAPPDHAAPPGTVEYGQPVMDRMIFVHGILNQFEGRLNGGDTPELRWSGQAWVGTDYDKFWLKTEGFRRADGSIDDGRHEFLYDRAISTYWDLQAGIRADIDSKPTRTWGAFGIQGLAPLFFDLEATGYVSDQGHFAGRLEASYDLLITQRLILQPLVEANFYSKSDPERLVGSGLSELDAGLRLRYEFTRKLAPYVGVAYEGKFGETATLARSAGESTGGARFVFGLRSWF
jgi:copper resistance protein B